MKRMECKTNKCYIELSINIQAKLYSIGYLQKQTLFATKTTTAFVHFLLLEYLEFYLPPSFRLLDELLEGVLDELLDLEDLLDLDDLLEADSSDQPEYSSSSCLAFFTMTMTMTMTMTIMMKTKTPVAIIA